METYGYIYLTTNLTNNKRYIGQHNHSDWDYSYYGSGELLKRAIKKYGIENFTCFPLMWAWNKEELNKLEIEYIEHYKPEYNIAPGGYGGCGKLSDEHKRKIGKAHKGKIVSEETKIKMGEGQKGNKHCLGRILSEETKQKIGKGNKGKILSGETKQKISDFNRGKIISEEQKKKIIESNKRRIYSEETKKKMSESLKGNIPWNKGKTNCYSEETKMKMSEARKNISDETRKRMREARNGIVFTEEHKKNLSEAQKRRWQNKSK
jgi:hypothetical protein